MAFDESSLKVTDGRAGTIVDQDVQRRFESTCANWQGKALPGEHSDKNKNMLGSLLGISAGHISVPKFEVGLMPGLQMAAKGTWLVAVVQACPFILHRDSGSNGRVKEDLSEFAASMTLTMTMTLREVQPSVDRGQASQV